MDKETKKLFDELGLDKETINVVWNKFTEVQERYSIEGDRKHWLACAIYAASHKLSTPSTATTSNTTPSNSPDEAPKSNHGSKSAASKQSASTGSKQQQQKQQQQIHQSSGPPLSKLLRLCELKLVDFLSKMDKWIKMTESPIEGQIRSSITHLECNFNVSAVMFKIYKQIFSEVFKPISASSKQSPERTPGRNRNSRTNFELSTADIYYFCWLLYVTIKTSRGRYPKSTAVSNDLCSSYHLLLTCIDFCFSNALASKFAHHVLNPGFKGLPDKFHSEDYKMKLDQPTCILQVLCDRMAANMRATDAKSCREYVLKPYIKELVERKILQVSHISEVPPETYLGIFDPSNFESNISKLAKEHEAAMLSAGEIDERIFLSENALKELGAPAYDLSDLKKLLFERHRATNISPPESQYQAPATENVDFDKQTPPSENGGRFVPQTPLSGRYYIQGKAAPPSSPVTNATRKVGDLYRMLADCTGEPTASLEDIFKLCTQNPRDIILERASSMVERFVERYTKDQKTEPQVMDVARKRAVLARKLYFKVLESIIVREQKRLPTDKIGDSLSSLLSHEIFHISLFACCVEIVLASHNATRAFQRKDFWVLDVYKDFGETHLYPFLFYKVIELVIREEERLSRDIVKHLATIEECVLDSMSWESDSPLWTAIAANGSVPSCQDVALPPSASEQNLFESPISSLRRHEGFQSPMSVSTRYSIAPLEGSARRRLFDGGLSGDTSLTAASPQILQVVMPHKTENGEIKYVILNPSAFDADHAAQRHEIEQSPTPIRPAIRANPLNLFFRKVYYLAQLRFRDLWSRLSINDMDLRQKIWTLFEYQIRNHTNLLRDRHLDQMIMCATYAINRVYRYKQQQSRDSSEGSDEMFKDFFRKILEAYKFQPQAQHESVFKWVLLVKPQLKFDISGTRTTPTMNTRSPTKRGAPISSPVKNGSGQSSAGSASNAHQSNLPERGDIITFYNEIYRPQVKAILNKFALQPDSSLSLSPLPRMNTNPISPYRRVSQQHSVYVSPLKSNSLPSSPGRQLSYNFHRSPAKDLQSINSMINKHRAACKRILQDDDGENNKRPRVSEVATKRIQDIMKYRQNHDDDHERRASK